MTDTKKVSAAAISGILKKAGFKRALVRNQLWFSGFEVQQNADSVSVCYNTSDSDDEAIERIRKIADTINNRPGQKYFAQPDAEKPHYICYVYAYDATDPEQNEARRATELEKLAAEHPAAPEIKDVRRALLSYGSEFVPDGVSGFHIERKSDDTRLVRVTWRETSSTTYGQNNTPAEKESIIYDTLENYGLRLLDAGFAVLEDYDNDWSLIVGMPGEFTPVDDSPEAVTEALAVLRDKVEADNVEHMTRRVGPYALFVFNQDSARRLEVAYVNGVYLSRGWVGRGEPRRFLKVDSQLLDFIRTELAC